MGGAGPSKSDVEGAAAADWGGSRGWPLLVMKAGTAAAAPRRERPGPWMFGGLGQGELELRDGGPGRSVGARVEPWVSSLLLSEYLGS